MERETGFEPATLSLEGWRSSQLSYSRHVIQMVERGGFEPPKAYADRFTVCSLWPLGNLSRSFLIDNKGFFMLAKSHLSSGAGDGTRTRNLLITNQLLYLLSYASVQTYRINNSLQKSNKKMYYFFHVGKFA
jgi:hypothetical protein